MKKKIAGILVITLLITIALPNISGNIIKNDNFCVFQDYEFVSGEFIIKFTENTKISSPSIIVLNEKYQVSSIAKIFRNSEDKTLYNIYLFSVPEDSDVLSIVKDYSSNPNVVYAEPNFIAQACATPNDTDFDLQWALHNTGQSGGIPDADIDAPEAWDIETGSPDVVITISDTGVDWDHPDIAANIWANSDEILDGTDTDGNGFIDDIRGWDFVNDDNDPMDDSGHGTSCAGIASAVTDNNIGVAGICWNCKIMPVKGLAPGGGTAQDLADGIIYAVDNGANIISMSWGSYFSSNLIKDALDYGYSQGVVLVAGAGNGNTDQKFYPAGYNNVIAVAATNHNDEKVYNSNYGSWVDVAAPGLDIYTTGWNNSYRYFDFTSAATPHVAGLAGLILSKNPSYTNEKVKSIIRNNTDPYNSSVYIGTGRINAHKTVKKARDQTLFETIMLRTRATFNSLFLWFLERFPLLEKLLNLLR